MIPSCAWRSSLKNRAFNKRYCSNGLPQKQPDEFRRPGVYDLEDSSVVGLAGVYFRPATAADLLVVRSLADRAGSDDIARFQNGSCDQAIESNGAFQNVFGERSNIVCHT